MIIVPGSFPGISLSELEDPRVLVVDVGFPCVLSGRIFHALGMPPREGGKGSRLYSYDRDSAWNSKSGFFVGYQLQWHYGMSLSENQSPALCTGNNLGRRGMKLWRERGPQRGGPQTERLLPPLKAVLLNYVAATVAII